MSNFIQAILGVLAVSSIPLVGLLSLAVSKKKLDNYSHWLVSFAVGALLGNALLHLIPEVFEESTTPTLSGALIILGVLLFYALEQFLRWHHSHDAADTKKPVAVMSIIGDSVHNFLDGLLIAGSFLVNPAIGWTTVIAVILHEIPQEIADFSILLHAAWPIGKIVLVNVLSGMLALLGVVVGFVINANFESFALVSLSITAGGFIYIACADLIPNLHKKGGGNVKQGITQLIIIGLGVLVSAIGTL
ncbi:ZIP family metal transporter [bacterium]|nr:ZIP family metal transporter [bacterium]